jgi:acetyl-CoA/propionyl-CoA carboxylase carboxyl transferase subunit
MMESATLVKTADLDPRNPLRRLSRLLDEDSIVPLREPGASSVRTARGRIDGSAVVVYCTDGAVMGGAIGAAECRDIVAAIETAVRERCPVIGLWHSAGARLREDIDALDGIGRMFAAMVAASGKIPQISVVLGPAAGGAAYGPALTDLVIMTPAARVFVTGPEVVRSVTGEKIDMEELGGPGTHGRRSGVAHVTADSEDDAYLRTRLIASLLARPGSIDEAPPRDFADLGALLPETAKRAYDVRPLIRRLLDKDAGFEELQRGWAPNIVVGLGRLCGRTTGIVANNPIRKGGCLDSPSAEKAARFVRMCDSFGIPLVVIVDVPGYLPGVRQEWDGIVRRGAKLLYAFAEASVPRVTLITRKSYGGAYIAMNSRALGATAVFAWPRSEVAIMGAEAAVGILNRKALTAVSGQEREALRSRLIQEHEAAARGLERGIAIGAIDEVISPGDTRRRIAETLAAGNPSRCCHGNIPL